MDSLYKNLSLLTPESEIKFLEPMIKHTSYGTGGAVNAFILPKNIMDLKILLKYIAENEINLFIAGSGSNLLVSDRGYNGVVISLNKTFKNLSIKNNIINVETGVMLGHMVKNAIKNELKGFESLVGVPGTVGGALIMNAGAYGSEISTYLDTVTSLKFNGESKTYRKNDLKFSYRKSSFPKNEIICKATFICEKGNIKKIKSNKIIASNKRKESQPLKFRSAGSIFKNPSSDIAAGYLIDKAGLKGTKIGNAEISNKHANFIINLGNAKSDDIIKLIKIIIKQVKEKFDIILELEVKLLGYDKQSLYKEI